MMNDLNALVQHLHHTPLAAWAHTLPALLEHKFTTGHGDLPRWQAAVAALPELTVTQLDLRDDLSLQGPCSPVQRQQLEQALRGLTPWRKGPFQLFGIHLDTEWRSDWKWQRVAPHIDLTGKRVLDVGCGNGYYLWRMLGAGANGVIGIDPNWLFFCQFHALKRYLPKANAWHLPLMSEELPTKLEGFDTVFSMGVLYHRRSPIDHLLALKDCLLQGGELVLETLVVEGDEFTALVPEDRYAQMRNVWFLPSVAALERWLRRTGFTEIRCVDVNITDIAEQRSTEWMRFQSLPAFLDPNDHAKTIEGLPAPMRAVLIARKP